MFSSGLTYLRAHDKDEDLPIPSLGYNPFLLFVSLIMCLFYLLRVIEGCPLQLPIKSDPSSLA